MTALAGVWNLSGKPDAGDACRRVLAAQRIYGPHGEAVWDSGEIAIGRALFELLPEDIYDRGPIAGGNDRYQFVGDVRLDNREELAETLGFDREVAARKPDAAFVLHAWERWQEAAFDRLYGDYAFALWEAGRRRLILARDHVGGRPLHYHRNPRFFAFASMPKGLHALSDVPCKPDEVRAAEFLALLGEHDSRSFFEGISRVEAGHFVAVTRDGITSHKHWQPKRTQSRLSFDDHVEGLREQIDRATLSRLRGAEGRVGAHLSAGLDSSTIAATAARLLAPAGGSVVAFTSAPRAGYDGFVPATRLGDEVELAAATAARYPNIEHVVLRTGGGSVLDDFDRDFYLFDRPLVNPDVQRWWNQINAEAGRRKVKVMLSAVMGNVSMTYDGATLLGELAVRGRWIALARVGQALRRRAGMRWTGVAAQAFGALVPTSVWHTLQRWRGHIPVALDAYSAINLARARELDLDGTARAIRHDFAYRPWADSFARRLWMLHRIDFGNNQKGVLAGWGVDLRDPTTDRRLVEFCLSIPADHYLRGGELRALARHALADRLPQSVLEERRKGLQSADWHEGLTAARDELRAEVLRLRDVSVAAQALDLDRLDRLTRDWPADKWNMPEVEYEYRFSLIRGIASGHFLRKASGSNA